MKGVSVKVQATARAVSRRSQLIHSCAICTTQRSSIFSICLLLTSFLSDPPFAFDLYSTAIKHLLDMFTSDKLSQPSSIRLRSVSNPTVNQNTPRCMFIDPIAVGHSCSRDAQAARKFRGVLHSMHVTCDNTAGAERVSRRQKPSSTSVEERRAVFFWHD
jgi:hypothetical protein